MQKNSFLIRLEENLRCICEQLKKGYVLRIDKKNILLSEELSTDVMDNEEMFLNIAITKIESVGPGTYKLDYSEDSKNLEINANF